MQIVYIKFNSREDQIRGFYELATKAQVTSLPGGVYAVPLKSLSLLDEQNISYRRAADAEVLLKRGSIRAPVTSICPTSIRPTSDVRKQNRCRT